MKRVSILLLILFTSLSLTGWAQMRADPQSNTVHQYMMYDFGTLGGASSSTSYFAPSLSLRGAIGGAETPAHDPFDPYCLGSVFFADCNVMHAYQWNKGILKDLGALGNNSENGSFASATNNFGWVSGYAENGLVDPSTGYPIAHAVVWKNGKITDIGTFGGTQSAAMALNDLGQVIGGALNNIDDPWSAKFYGGFGYIAYPGTTQLRAFVWQNGHKRDLGTLGGPDAFAYAINRFGQIAGESYTSDTPNDTTGIPTIDPFLWTNGKMIDLGSLGGTIGFTVWMNDWGQVVGVSNVYGDMTNHGFLWSFGKMIDLLPTSSGQNSFGLWINDLGDVIGSSTVSGEQLYHASLWSFGKATDLGTFGDDACAEAFAINDFRQIVGYSDPISCQTSGRAFLWQNGTMYDLNALVENPSDLYLYVASYIDDRGEIVAQGVLPDGSVHTALLIPSNACESSCQQRISRSLNAMPRSPAKSPFARPSSRADRLGRNKAKSW
ncbi:MAG TPA: hypothetical protein VMT28_14260 [Terriglobales bacterium]|nr:hypothetical protein [Terriglobales bacterium]